MGTRDGDVRLRHAMAAALAIALAVSACTTSGGTPSASEPPETVAPTAEAVTPTLPPTLTPTLAPTPTPTPTVELITTAADMVGTWHRTTPSVMGGEIYRRFAADGSYRMADTLEHLDSAPRVSGTFRFEESRLMVQDLSGTVPWDECVAEKQIGTYQVRAIQGGNIAFVKVSDDCKNRGSILPSGEYERVP